MNKRILKIVLFTAGIGAPFTLLDASPAFFPEGFRSDLSPAFPGRPFLNPHSRPVFRPLPAGGQQPFAFAGMRRGNHLPAPPRYTGHFHGMPRAAFRPEARPLPMHAGHVPPRYAPYAGWGRGSPARPSQFHTPPRFAAPYRFRPLGGAAAPNQRLARHVPMAPPSAPGFGPHSVRPQPIPDAGFRRPVSGPSIAGDPRVWSGPRYASQPARVGPYRFRPIDLPLAPYRAVPRRHSARGPVMASFAPVPGAYRFRPAAYTPNAKYAWRPAPVMRYSPQWAAPVGATLPRQLADYRFRPDPRFQPGHGPVAESRFHGLHRQVSLGDDGSPWLAAMAQGPEFAD